MTIGRKVVVGFVVAGVVLVSAACLGISQTRSINEQLTALVEERIPAMNALTEIRAGIDTAGRALNGDLVPEVGANPKMSEAGAKMFEGALARIEAGRDLWNKVPHSEGANQKWKELQPLFETWVRSVRELHNATTVYNREASAGSGDTPSVREARANAVKSWNATRQHYVAMAQPLDVLAAMNRDRVQTQREAAQATTRNAVVGLILAALGGLAVLAAFGFFIGRSVRRSVLGLASEAGKLTSAVGRGALAVRGDPGAVSAEFRGIVRGMNETMDAFVKPIELTSRYADQIARGEIPPKITEPYEGDFNSIKQSLNTCIDAVNGLIADAVALSSAAVEGKLDARADASKHAGDYRKIMEGVNATLDAVVTPLNEATSVLQILAQRDLKARMNGNYRGDHAKIKEALNATAVALHDSIAQVAGAVNQVSSASGQIASSSEAVAAGASEQASSLEETSASLESMSSMAKHAADNAQQANGLAQGAQTAATEGSAQMEQMTTAMGKIKASAEGTSQIIKDINEIAFQTNLLALNAAVEAARAGEAGRGFAVVAEEVRSLALRSKDAANKTEDLIRQSVKEAGEGEVTAKRVNAKLAEIAGAVTKVSGIVAEIAATAKEQTVGIDQVAKAVMQMNAVTQQNAASSEESSSAAAELSGQSEELKTMVRTFKLEQVTAAAKPIAPKSAAAPGPLTLRRHGGAMKAIGKSGLANGVAPAQLIPLDDDRSFSEF